MSDPEWVGSSQVLLLARLGLKSKLYKFDLQQCKMIEENIGGITWNLSDSFVVRDTFIYSIGYCMSPGNYNKKYSVSARADKKDLLGMHDQGDVDFFHSGISVLDLGAKKQKWKHLPHRRKMMICPTSAILGHNIYAFSASRALVYDINTDKWEDLIRPPELLERRKSMIASSGRPILHEDPRRIRYPVISDTLNNRLLVNFWYAFYAYYPQESRWECLIDNKSDPCVCFWRGAQLFDNIIYFFCPGRGPYCINAYDVTTNKPIPVLWSDNIEPDAYEELDHMGSHCLNRYYDVELFHLGDGMMCLVCCSSLNIYSSTTCFRFVRFRVKLARGGGVLITAATIHKVTVPTCYNEIGCLIPL